MLALISQNWEIHPSPFHAGHGHALDEVALEEEEDGDDGEGHEDVAGHDEGPVGGGGVELVDFQAVDAESEGEFGLVAEVDEGLEEFVPGGHEGEDGDGGEGGGDVGEDDVIPGLDGVEAVDAGGFLEVAGDGAHVLGHEEDEEGGAEEGGDPDGVESIVPVQAAPDEEAGDHGDLGGEHHGGEQ